MDIMERYRGCLLGLAVGDAVGTTLEFRSPGTFKPITGMTGGGPFGLMPGQWTDDTSMALCLAESLIEKRGFDARDQIQRYLRWWHEGYLSCTDACFDIGHATMSALSRFARTGQPLSGSTDPNSAGNGSIMRLAPVPMLYALDPERAIEFAAESSRTTHAATTAVDACRYFAALIVGALRGVSKEELLSDHYSPVKGYWEKHPLTEEIREICSGSFRHKEPPAIVGSGYVVRSLEAALWAFHKCRDFREGCLLAANLGDDADTTAAVYGQLAGAFYGEAEIPQEWRSKLAMCDRIEAYAIRIYELSRQTGASDSSSRKDFGCAEVHQAAEQEVLPKPIARSYWVVPGKFLAGAYPSDTDPSAASDKMRALLNAGIRYFINLTSIQEMNIHGDQLAAYQDLAAELAAGHHKINYRRMPITDLDVTTPAQMSKILDVIDGAVLSGIPIYIHCLGGIGRTGTVVGCWLARHGIANGEAALDLIRRLRRKDSMANRPSPETARQCRFVCEWVENE